jgi:hypothetical protein
LAPPFDTSKPEGAVTVTSPVRFAPLTVKVCVAEAVPAVVLNAANVPMVVIDGGGATVPLTATVWFVAPVLDTVILPEAAPTGAVALMRTETVVAPSEPPLTVKLRESAKLVPSIDTSKLAGAATVTLSVRLAPLTVKVCTAEAVPCVELKATKDDNTVREGGNPTVPLTAKVCVATPGDPMSIAPSKLPRGAEVANRTEIVVDATDPLLWARVREVKKFVPSVDTSKLAGAATVTLPVRFAPLTEKVWAVEAVPCVAVNAASVPVTIIAGGGTTVPVTPTVLLLAPPLDTVMLPLGEPTLAAAERRTEIVVLVSVPPL